MKKTCILLVSFWCKFALAQIPNEVISNKSSLNLADSGVFGLSLNNLNYMRNTEYFNPIEEGRTLFGYQLNPKFYWQPASNVKLEAGLWLRHDFGNKNPFTQALPTFTLRAKKKNLEILFGTIDGALSHGMLEPMFDINCAILKPIENGFQLKQLKNNQLLDFWINWENFIEPNENNKERFTAGMHFRRGYDLKSGIKIEPYIQFLASHQGGQIDADTTSPFLMQFNGAIGLKVQKEWLKERCVFADAAYLGYQETSDSKLWPKTHGNGVLANVGYRFKKTNFIVSYWEGNHFIAPRGTRIYQSESTVDAKNYESNRKLIYFRLIQNKPFFNSPIMVSARFEPVYDLQNKIFDFSYSLYLVYRGNWKFGKNTQH